MERQHVFQQIFHIYHAKIALKTLFIAQNIVQNFNIFQRWKLLREREKKKSQSELGDAISSEINQVMWLNALNSNNWLGILRTVINFV